jgi:hypothetical protein
MTADSQNNQRVSCRGTRAARVLSVHKGLLPVGATLQAVHFLMLICAACSPCVVVPTRVAPYANIRLRSSSIPFDPLRLCQRINATQC